MSTVLNAAPWDPALAHRFVTGDGTALHVCDEGAPGEEPTVVLVHGWTQDHTSWDPVVDALRANGFGSRILRHDHRGHGGSAPAPRGTATIARIAEDLAELIADRVPKGKLVLAGHSMGGATIMALAGQHPELVERLAGVAFVATTSGGLSELTFGLPRQLALRVYAGEAVLSRYMSRSDRAAFLRHPAALRPVVRRLTFGKGARRADVTATAEQIGRCHPASMISFLDSLLAHERAGELAQLANTPVTIYHGDRDRLIPRAHARVIANELPHARFVQFPQAGHILPAERAGEVAHGIARLTERARRR
ncbi:alpha/beta fold hydrolase [Sciscionella sediminilitoris]|uniref:alpha/beta fold hydrolase n=1 Tax=Sciscionella sediminilitoris TaxID=1445613 RepID=UPI0004DEF382|nr:alpha/beta hydrolase [Sciscionella sp. SE31]